MADLVIPLGKGSCFGDNSELRILLRSVERNAKDVSRIFLVGEKPEWVKGVTHIPCDDPFCDNKDANIIYKLITACEHPGLEERFVWSCDDHAVLSPVSFASLGASCAEWKVNDIADNTWKIRRDATRTKLSKILGDTFPFYDVHVPQPVLKSVFPRVMKSMNATEHPGVTVNTAWLAPAVSGRLVRADRSLKRCFIDFTLDREGFVRLLRGCTFASWNNDGWKGGLKELMFELFPEKSRWEKD